MLESSLQIAAITVMEPILVWLQKKKKMSLLNLTWILNRNEIIEVNIKKTIRLKNRVDSGSNPSA